MDELQQAVERGQHCRASLLESRTVTVRHRLVDQPASRFIKTFTLHGHSTANRAYAWQRGENPHPDEPEYCVVLSALGINSAEDALTSKFDELWRAI
jgi:hypothetical protein